MPVPHWPSGPVRSPLPRPAHAPLVSALPASCREATTHGTGSRPSPRLLSRSSACETRHSNCVHALGVAQAPGRQEATSCLPPAVLGGRRRLGEASLDVGPHSHPLPRARPLLPTWRLGAGLSVGPAPLGPIPISVLKHPSFQTEAGSSLHEGIAHVPGGESTPQATPPCGPPATCPLPKPALPEGHLRQASTLWDFTLCPGSTARRGSMKHLSEPVQGAVRTMLPTHGPLPQL